MTNALDRIAQRQQPDHLGQATAVEQSRATAEVEAAVIVAQRFPRNVPAAIAAMEEACAQIELAEVAFYEFPRGRETVEGPSIHLARELARVWGNIQYGVHEMVRDDVRGQSEMLAFAWDLQTNSRNSSVFIVPHVRDKRGGPERLTDMRDIYENNANNGARRVREAIFAVLPKWFSRQAEEKCRETLRDGGGVPLAQRTADVIARFGKGGITSGQLEKRLGRPSTEWTPDDLAKLHVVWSSLKRGELTRDEAFPQQQVTPADITGGREAPERPQRKRPGKADLSAAFELRKLLDRLPIGPPETRADDEQVLLSWLAGHPFADSPEDIAAVLPQLQKYVEDAGGDPEEAVKQMWLLYDSSREDGSDE